METKKQSYIRKHKSELVVAACCLAFVLLVIGLYFVIDHFHLGLRPNSLTLVVKEVEYDEEHDEYIAKGYDAITEKDYTFNYHGDHAVAHAHTGTAFAVNDVVTINYYPSETKKDVIHAISLEVLQYVEPVE